MMEIIRTDERHVSDIGALWLEFMRFHQEIDPIFAPRDGAVTGFEENEVRRLIRSENGLVLVALDEGRVVGYALSEVRGPKEGYKLEKHGAIDNVAVMASYRRRGVGDKLVREILTWFQSRDVDRVELEVLAQNQVGYSFWRRHGFTDYRHRLFRRI